MTEWEIAAILYARAERKRSEAFIGGDPHDGPQPMAYYVWLLRSGTRAILVDTGCDAATAAARGRTFVRCPGETIADLGVDPATVETVILTHLHHDHAGNHHLFGAATFHVQAAEMAYATGPWMTHPSLRAGYGAADIKAMVERLFADRIVFHEGRGEVASGVEVVPIGGHTAGLQSVVVRTARGPVVVASDAAILYEGLMNARPFPAAFHVGGELAGYRTLRALAVADDAIIPGHDPLVMERYPALIDGLAWRVDVEPFR